jgi:NAD(P)-dependent dehydrogenase (short-subunit alcohol dehydrogenase family)
MGRVENKTAVVTGGSLGIGRAACQKLAQEGANVAIFDIDSDNALELVSEINETDAGGQVAFWDVDVADEEQVAEAMSKAFEGFGSLDILVNNAGISGPNRPTHEIAVEEWERLMGINVRGVFLCTKHAIPLMRRSGGGSIINLSSIYGIVGAPDLPAYHASKGAVRLMSKTDALLYATEGIRVNSVHPGYVWTPLVEDLARQSDDGPEAFRQRLDAAHPIGHVGEPDDIAWGIVYLASDESKFVTGSELVIDGGYTAQ